MSRWWATMAHVHVVLFVGLATLGYVFGDWWIRIGAVSAAIGLLLALVKLREHCRMEDHMKVVRTLMLAQEARRWEQGR